MHASSPTGVPNQVRAFNIEHEEKDGKAVLADFGRVMKSRFGRESRYVRGAGAHERRQAALLMRTFAGTAA